MIRRLGDDPRRGRDPVAHLRIGPHVEIVHDPHKLLDAAVDLSTGRAHRPTSWMQRNRNGGATRVSSIGHVHDFAGRVCCYEHLRRFDGRPDLELPFETTCPGPGCGRVFRVTLAVTRSGSR